MSAGVFEPIAVPLREDEHGAIRVGDSRVLLELVICAFLDGATAEAIVQRYDTLKLPDVYAVITYYLAHPARIDEYLRRCEDEAAALRRTIEAKQPARPNLREVLLKRARERETGRASAGE
jgi:uncharacterized protein (DUF433 family)